mmetsp:Transcript_43083/g.125355  ORF Transcript_43083/g.125355 Transcript_43083/m.125355 type:complete len:326 (+) Transcript_43083:484-1461(+)
MRHRIHEEGDVLHAAPAEGPREEEAVKGFAPQRGDHARHYMRPQRVPPKEALVVEVRRGAESPNHAVVLAGGEGEFPDGIQPAEVRVPPALRPVVRVLHRVARDVVHRMGQAPAPDGALVRDGEHDHQQPLHRGAGHVGLVRPEAVCAGCHAQPADDPQGHGEHPRRPADVPPEEQGQPPECQYVAQRYPEALHQDTVLVQLEDPVRQQRDASQRRLLVRRRRRALHWGSTALHPHLVARLLRVSAVAQERGRGPRRHRHVSAGAIVVVALVEEREVLVLLLAEERAVLVGVEGVPVVELVVGAVARAAHDGGERTGKVWSSNVE